MKTGPKPRSEIDLHLAVALSTTPRGQTWSDTELAEFCGCHHSRIQQIQASAFRKLRLSPSLAKLFAEMLKDAPRVQKAHRRPVRESQTLFRAHGRLAQATETVAYRTGAELFLAA